MQNNFYVHKVKHEDIGGDIPLSQLGIFWVSDISRCGDQKPGDFLIFSEFGSENRRGHRGGEREK